MRLPSQKSTFSRALSASQATAGTSRALLARSKPSTRAISASECISDTDSSVTYAPGEEPGPDTEPCIRLPTGTSNRSTLAFIRFGNWFSTYATSGAIVVPSDVRMLRSSGTMPLAQML